MERKLIRREGIENIVLYAAAILFVDSILTPELSGGRTLHEMLGLNFLEGVEKYERFFTYLGIGYSLFFAKK